MMASGMDSACCARALCFSLCSCLDHTWQAFAAASLRLCSGPDGLSAQAKVTMGWDALLARPVNRKHEVFLNSLEIACSLLRLFSAQPSAHGSSIYGHSACHHYLCRSVMASTSDVHTSLSTPALQHAETCRGGYQPVMSCPQMTHVGHAGSQATHGSRD